MKILIKNIMKKHNFLISLAALILTLSGMTATAFAQGTSGDLVNTESFFIIDDGDGTTNVQLQFGTSLGEILEYDLGNTRFVFSDDLYIQGNLDIEGESFSVNSDGTGADSSVDFNAGAGSLQYNNATDDFTLSDELTINGDLNTDSNLLLDANGDGAGGNIDIQFGSVIGERIRWDDVASTFSISDDLYIDGILAVNGNVDFNQNLAVEMVIDQGTAFPTVPGPVEGQTFYRTDLNVFYIYDGASWIAFADAAGSNSIFLSPNYPNVTFYGDTSNNTGQLTYYFDNTNIENAYKWSTSKNSLQDYDLKVRIQVPDNFANWDTTHPLEFKYRTLTTLAADNQLDFSMQDTADASVTMANNSALISGTANTWEDPQDPNDMTITGGTWTPGDWFTVTIKLTAKKFGAAEAGSLVFNYDTN